MSTSLSARIEKAAKVLDVPDAQESIINVLKNLGVDESETGLSILESEFVTFEDFNNELHTVPTSAPLPRRRMAWSILKGEDTKKKEVEKATSELDTLIKTIRPIQQWSNQELIDEYTKDGKLVIHEELARRSKGRHVIIFNEEGVVDTENSLHMLKKAQFQDTPQVYKLKTGDLREVYRVGDFPLQLFHECPIHKDVLLLDDYCEECGTHWNLEEDERNVLLRLLSESVRSMDFRLYMEKSLTELKSLFPKTWLQYRTLKEEGNLPSLKRRISKPKAGDPFRVIGTNKTF